MKAFVSFLIGCIACFAFAVSAQAQTAADFELHLHKATGALDIVRKPANEVVTAQYQIVAAELDIYDKKGTYAGSLQLQDGKIPTNELTEGETLKTSKIQLVEKASGKTLDLKDIAVALK